MKYQIYQLHYRKNKQQLQKLQQLSQGIIFWQKSNNNIKNWSSNVEYVYNYVILIAEEQRLKQQSRPPTNIPGRLEVILGMEEQSNAWGHAWPDFLHCYVMPSTEMHIVRETEGVA